MYVKYLLGGGQLGAMLTTDYEKYAHLTDDPQTIREVRARLDAELWEHSINDELASLVAKQVCDVVATRNEGSTSEVRFRGAKR